MKKIVRNKRVITMLNIFLGVLIITAGVSNLILRNYLTANWVFFALMMFAIGLTKDKIIDLQDTLIEDVLKLSDDQNKFIEKHMVVKTPGTPSPEPK